MRNLRIAALALTVLSSGWAETLDLMPGQELPPSLIKGKPNLVEFYADWCGPCKNMAPKLETFANDTANNTVLLRINVDQHQELAKQFEFKSIPFFVRYDDSGNEISRGQEARDWVNSTILDL